MEKEKRRNLIIAGIGSSYGGAVQTAKIDGIGKIQGDVACTDFILHGRAEIDGSIQAGKAEIHGTAAVQGHVRAERLILHGSVSVEGGLSGDRMRIDGSVTAKGACEAETFEANGRLVLGMLNAGDIRITLHGSSRIAEIGGESVRIRKQPGIDFAKWLKALPMPTANKLSADTIEGDIIHLEATKASVVRGTDVYIGHGCDIGQVEYKSKFEQHPKAQVHAFRQV